MIDFTSIELSKLSVHWVGNKLREEGIVRSGGSTVVGDPPTRDHILKYLLSSFKGDEIFNFHHQNDLKLNAMYAYTNRMFRDGDSFHDFSMEIAKHLYECSLHPKIEGGELWVADLSGCVFEGKTISALGVFRSNPKKPFLKTKSQDGSYDVTSDEGISLDGLEKGCIILNTAKEDGFKIALTDSKSSSDAQYWSEQFLKIKATSDIYNSTKNTLTITKEFVAKALPNDLEISKADQIDILNKSIEYFKKNDNYVKTDFEKQVLGDKKLINSFRKFDTTFRDENSLSADDEFEISNSAVKKQARIFKSVLKLDKNFHIYIHGDKSHIEKGQDKNGRKYYKLYYDEES
jgi:hypothetical protein